MQGESYTIGKSSSAPAIRGSIAFPPPISATQIAFAFPEIFSNALTAATNSVPAPCFSKNTFQLYNCDN